MDAQFGSFLAETSHHPEAFHSILIRRCSSLKYASLRKGRILSLDLTLNTHGTIFLLAHPYAVADPLLCSLAYLHYVSRDIKVRMCCSREAAEDLTRKVRYQIISTLASVARDVVVPFIITINSILEMICVIIGI